MKHIKLKGLAYSRNAANYTYNTGILMNSVIQYKDIGFRLFMTY